MALDKPPASDSVVIRPETPDDIPAIHEVVAAAFQEPDEAGLVDALRDAGKSLLSLVAVLDGRVVGHIMFSLMRVEPAVITAVGLAPLAVAPELQRQGIGSRLARIGIAEMRRRNYDAVFVLGSTVYYPRFGFEATLGRNLSAPGLPISHLQVIEMWEGAVGQTPLTVRFADEFDGMSTEPPPTRT
jgi:putative acetyltransferase